MNSIEQIQQAFGIYLQKTFTVDQNTVNACQFELNVDEGKQEFGDLNSNTALVLAKQLKRNPQELAQEIAKNFTHTSIEKIDIAGPGFLNIHVTLPTFKTLAQNLFCQGEAFFKSNKLEKKHNVSLEFVSANPTGPLHFGHGRGGIIGDVLANVLRFLGHYVTKEFYINDAGAQMKKLGISLKIRCEQAAGMKT